MDFHTTEKFSQRQKQTAAAREIEIVNEDLVKKLFSDAKKRCATSKEIFYCGSSLMMSTDKRKLNRQEKILKNV